MATCSEQFVTLLPSGNYDATNLVDNVCIISYIIICTLINKKIRGKQKIAKIKAEVVKIEKNPETALNPTIHIKTTQHTAENEVVTYDSDLDTSLDITFKYAYGGQEYETKMTRQSAVSYGDDELTEGEMLEIYIDTEHPNEKVYRKDPRVNLMLLIAPEIMLFFILYKIFYIIINIVCK